jgi:hypothetical protein
MTTSSLLVRFRLCAFLLIGLAALCILGCDSPGGTIREIRKNLDSFKANPSAPALEKLEKSFLKIDAAIKDLETKDDLAQADLFRRQAMTLRYEYRAMRAAFIKWSEEQSVKEAAGGSGE